VNIVRKSFVAALASLGLAPLAGFAQDTGGEKQVDPAALEGKIEALEEQLSETRSDVAGLKKLKISGYVQGRFVDDQSQGYLAGNSVSDQFIVRRARAKLTYDASWSEYVLEFDAVPSGVSLKEAYGMLKLPYGATLTVGQFKFPIGYENQQSSSEREMPELARVVASFVNGEYDRGVRLAARYKFLNLKLAVVNGNGANYKGLQLGSQTYGGSSANDNDKQKDVVGRLGVDFGWVVAGVSGWLGSTFVPGNTVAGSWVPGKFHDRTRVGADVQLYLDLVPIGGTAIKGELIAGKTWSNGGTDMIDLPALGWYVFLLQNLTTADAVFVRYDTFRGDLGAAPAVDARGKALSTNKVSTLGFGAQHWFDETLKVSVAYEIPVTTVPDGATDPQYKKLTIQAQVKF
jgi:hypothetical protein